MGYLGTKPANAVVTSEQLADGVVATADLANSAVTPAKLSQPFTAGTAVASTSGTSIDFTGIPSWVKRITVNFNSVSLNGSANFLLQLGTSSGVENTGYNSSSIYGGTASGSGSSSSGFLSITGAGTNIMSGAFTFTNLSGNTWVMTGMNANNGGTIIVFATGSKATASTLDRVRITTTNGTDTFDAGTINTLYE